MKKQYVLKTEKGGEITLERRRGVRGDRSVLVDGVEWMRFEYIQRGRHGGVYRAQSVGGTWFSPLKKDGTEYRYSYEEVSREKKRFGIAPAFDAEAAMITLAKKLIDNGRVESPAQMLAERQERLKRIAAQDAKRKAEREQMKYALVAAFQKLKTAGKPYCADGIALAYSEIFLSDISEVKAVML